MTRDTHRRSIARFMGGGYGWRGRLASGEDEVEGDGVAHRGHSHRAPGQAVVGAVDLDLGVEPYLVGAGGGERGVEAQRPGTVADGEGAGDGDAPAGGADPVDAEG